MATWQCGWEPERCKERGEAPTQARALRDLQQHYRTQHAAGQDR